MTPPHHLSMWYQREGPPPPHPPTARSHCGYQGLVLWNVTHVRFAVDGVNSSSHIESDTFKRESDAVNATAV